jgi:2-keto-4-pentenoate hydratase/2-oxohepta-3-ene-1,7-dioic acid hydratase in catechol pathway
MIIARVQSNGPACWAVLNISAKSWRAIETSFEEWAPAAARGSIDEHLLGPARDLRPTDLRAPLELGARIFAAGRNYGEHLLRLGADIPSSPQAFLMADSAIIGPADEIVYPPTTAELDYEIELVAVLAQPLRKGKPATASLLGYTIGNDVSARDAAKLAGQSDLFSQKSCDGTTPVGPWIVTLDEIGGPGQPQLDFRLSVNGEERQRDNTASMLFSVDDCLDYINDRVSVRSGDLLFTGTSSGVGLETGRFLNPGDLVEGTIERIGVLSNRVGLPRRTSRFIGQ